ncbi:MAG TPA: hypothetical protein VG894_10500, partial [Bauldia sp.]|nr:hypothetical protein [Bauldia sp.]
MGKRSREDGQLDAAAVAAIVGGVHDDPFGVLGPHQKGKDWVVRAFVPGAESLSVSGLDGTKFGTLKQRDPA